MKDTHILKPYFKRKYASLIDRFGALAIVFQISVGVSIEKNLTREQKEDLKFSLVRLINRFCIQSSYNKYNPPTSRVEQRQQKQYNDIEKQCLKYTKRKLDSFKASNNTVGVSFCRQLLKYKLFHLKSWDGMFVAVTRWRCIEVEDVRHQLTLNQSKYTLKVSVIRCIEENVDTS